MSIVDDIAGSERGHLLKILGVTFGVAVAVGDMIGSGILRAPSTLAATVPSIGLIMGLWVLGGVNAALNGNVNAELGTAIPKSGGPYNYAHRAFGDVGGLIIGWANWLAFVAGTGAAAISFANFLPLLWPWAAQHTIGVAVAMLLGLFGANIIGVREGGVLQEGTSLIKAVMLAVFCVAAVLFTPTSQPLPPAMAAAPMLGWGAAIAAFQLIRGAYAGWDSPYFFGEEVIDAGRALPRAMYIGMALTAVLYIGVNAALLYALGLNGVASSPLPFTIVLEPLGPVAKVLFALTAMITVASCANANIMGGPRILFSLSRDGLLPHWFMSVNKGGTPTVALLLTALFSIGLAVSGAFERVFALIGTLNGMAAIAMAVALFVLRRREPDLPRPYRTFLYPFLPALTLIIEVVFLILYSWTDTLGILFAIGLSIACVPFALIARHGKLQ